MAESALSGITLTLKTSDDKEITLPKEVRQKIDYDLGGTFLFVFLGQMLTLLPLCRSPLCLPRLPTCCQVRSSTAMSFDASKRNSVLGCVFVRALIWDLFVSNPALNSDLLDIRYRFGRCANWCYPDPERKLQDHGEG